ncbi:hypothetical protein PENSPDRAFT_756213 [Peniophora sp. CONT]|nr:hypothetical protein PENSPDRAFT_756213 [Peniophora sp. CONT]
MLPLILAGILGILPFLYTRMPSPLQRWMSHNPFSLSSSSSSNHQDAALQAEPLYFHIDPGKIPDVDIAVDGKVLPPLLFPIVSGPHCLADTDIAPQPVCYAVVDDPEFFEMALYRSDDPFVQSWDQLRASLVYLAGTRMAVTLAICFVLALFIPFVPDLVHHVSNMAYTIASAGFIFGYSAACHAVGLASVLLYVLDAVSWILNGISGGVEHVAHDEGAMHVDAIGATPVYSSTDPTEPTPTSAFPRFSPVLVQAEAPKTVLSESSSDLAAPSASLPTVNAQEDRPDASTSSLEVEPASLASICEEPSMNPSSNIPARSSPPPPSVSAASLSGSGSSHSEVAPLSPATIGGLSLKALYTCSKQYQTQITDALPTSTSVLEADSAPGTVSSVDVDTRRVRFNSDSITLRSSQSLFGQENSFPDAYSRSRADAAVLDRSLELKEAEVQRLERAALAPVSPLGFNLRALNVKEVTPSPSPPSFAKYELPAVRLARMRTQSESPASLASPKTPIDGANSNVPRVQEDTLDTPGPSIADYATNWRTRRSRGSTFSVMKQDDVGSPLYPKSALRKTEITPSSPITPASGLADAPISTPIRMPLGPSGEPFKKRRAVTIAVKADTAETEAADWTAVAAKRRRMRTRTSSRNEKENMPAPPALWNVVTRTPRPRLPSSGPSFFNLG